MKRVASSLLLSFAVWSSAFALPPDTASLDVARLVADRVVDNTRFELGFGLHRPSGDAEVVDFGRSCVPLDGVAYALTTMNCASDITQTFEVGCRAPLRIWIDGKVVYDGPAAPEYRVEFDEKSYKLPGRFSLTLAAGDHTVLVKSLGCTEGEWQMVLQSPDMGRYARKGMRIDCSLARLAPGIDAADWLVIGSFPGDMDTVLPPEEAIELHRVYSTAAGPLKWNIPRIDLLSNGGEGRKFSEWSYNNGCFAWAMQSLAHTTGQNKYLDYADRWCENALATIPTVEYQTRILGAVRSMNFGLAGRPMLDYVSAPSMPFLMRLAAEGEDFPQRAQYYERAHKVVEYLLDQQFRTGGVFARTYTDTPSVWADDMFMGLPFLVWYARVTEDRALRERLLDDASSQALRFGELLCDAQTGLYRQACYPARPEEKVPFWSRGNGWAFWAVAEVLDALPQDHPNYRPLVKLFRRHAAALARCQDGDGFWRNILDMEGSTRESSGAAIFVLGFARGVDRGWLEKNDYHTAIIKGWKALLTFVADSGDFEGVKGGTNFSTDPADYERVPFITSDTHGLLPLVFACIAMNDYLAEYPLAETMN